MKKIIHISALFSVTAVLLASCQGNGAIQGAVSAGGNSEDCATCENITRTIYNPHIGQSEVVPRFSTRRFVGLLQRGWVMPSPTSGPYLNHDFRFDTQDDTPDVLSIGPAASNGSQIDVPVILRFGPNGKPFKKIWVFFRESGGWRVDDVVTSGHELESQNGSLANDLEKNA
jgi:predicted small secreted protein